MGTVGLSFGSATSGAGFDVTSTVSSILAIAQGVETPWKTQLTALSAQDTVLTTLGTDLSTLTTKLQAVTDFDGVLAEKDGSSSNTDVLALSSATASASAGSHSVVINSLAQTSSSYSSAVAATDTLSGSLTIQVGSGTAQTITVGSTSNTLSSLSAAINAASVGVKASIITDSSGSRLSLVSSTSGSAGQLTFTNNLNDNTTSSALALQTGSTGSDASLTVDGVALTSSSNTVSNAISGVTFHLLNTSATPVDVEITNSNSAISGAISDFVTAYNTVVADLTKQEGKDSSGNAEPLYGDPTLSLLQTQLASALLGGTASGKISSVTQLGITVNKDATLTFNSSDFTSALDADFDDIAGFLQNAGSFGSNFATVLNGLGTSSTSGAIYLAQQQNSSQETLLNKNVSDEDARIATEKTTLTAELNEANEILQSIPSQLDEVNETYSAVTGYGEKS